LRAVTQFNGGDDLVFHGDSAGNVLNRRTFQDIFARALDGEHREDETKPPRIVKAELYLTPLYDIRPTR
jgi:hypothetical protein